MKYTTRITASLLCAACLQWLSPSSAEECCRICGSTACESICESIFWTAKPAPELTQKPMQTPSSTPNPTRKPTVTVPMQTPKPESTQKPSQSMGDYTTDSVYAQEQIAWNLMNQDRMNSGLSALSLDSALSDLARLKSRDMAENRYFSHTSPTYGSAADMLRSHGYVFQAVGENIAHHATVIKSQAAFMSSDGHRRNILGKNWNRVGIGVWQDAQGYVYVTQLFAR